MTEIVDWARLRADYLERIDPRSFLTGVGAIAAFYALLFLYALLASSATVEKLESGLAHQTVAIEHEAPSIAGMDSGLPTVPGVSLSVAPEPGLLEKTGEGMLPVIRASDGLSSFEQYRRPYRYGNVGRPIIALAMTDFGLSHMASQTALKALPPAVSFILSPYSDQPQAWINAARENGHEVWLGIPVENKSASFSDPGPASLLARSSLEANRDALHWSLSRATGYVGIASFTDDSFYRAELMLDNLVSEFFKRGLGYMEMNAQAPSTIQNIALRQNAPYIRSDLWIYAADGLDQSFAQMEQTAHTNGFAMAVIPGFPANIGRLAQWLAQHENQYTFVPASSYYDAPMHAKADSITEDRSAAANAPRPLNTQDHYEPESH